MSDTREADEARLITVRAADEALLIAVRAADEKGVRTALASGARVSARAAKVFAAADDEPVLALAVRVAHPGIVRLLLDAGADPNEQFVDDLALERSRVTATVTPFIVASWRPVEAILEAMLAYGADVKAHDPAFDVSVLKSAITFGLSALAKRFVEGGARDPEALVEAARLGDLELVRWLVERIPASTDALRIACEQGHRAIAECLVSAGAPLEPRADTATSPMRTPLYAAASRGDAEFVEWLVALGVDLVRAGPAALTNAVAHRADTRIAQFLLDRGVPVDSRTDYGWTALMCAVTRGQPEAVRLLLERGADLDATDPQGKRAIDWAKYEKRAEMVALLEAAGAR